MHLTQGLQKLQSSLHTVMLSMDQKIDRLGSMAEELHVAKGHLKKRNFLKMNGKDTAKITERNPEQGIIFQTQKVLFQSMRSIHKLEQKNRAIAAADREAGRETRKTGIFKRYLAGASAGNSTPSAWEKKKKQKAAIR